MHNEAEDPLNFVETATPPGRRDKSCAPPQSTLPLTHRPDNFQASISTRWVLGIAACGAF